MVRPDLEKHAPVGGDAVTRSATWLTLLCEHTTILGTFFHDVLHFFERNICQTVPVGLTEDVIDDVLTLILKTKHTHDLGTVCDNLVVAHTKVKATAEQTVQALN